MQDNKEMSTRGLHIFIFCCAEYENLVEQCARSIDEFIEDPILSKNIISNKNVKVNRYNPSNKT
jgi:hypothetical protein